MMKLCGIGKRKILAGFMVVSLFLSFGVNWAFDLEWDAEKIETAKTFGTNGENCLQIPAFSVSDGLASTGWQLFQRWEGEDIIWSAASSAGSGPSGSRDPCTTRTGRPTDRRASASATLRPSIMCQRNTPQKEG